MTRRHQQEYVQYRRVKHHRSSYDSGFHGFVSSFSLAFPRAIEFPFSYIIFCRYPYFEPSIAFTISTVTVWPMASAMSARVTPTLVNHLGGLLSNFQFSTLPSSPFTSM